MSQQELNDLQSEINSEMARALHAVELALTMHQAMLTALLEGLLELASLTDDHDERLALRIRALTDQVGGLADEIRNG